MPAIKVYHSDVEPDEFDDRAVTLHQRTEQEAAEAYVIRDLVELGLPTRVEILTRTIGERNIHRWQVDVERLPRATARQIE